MKKFNICTIVFTDFGNIDQCISFDAAGSEAVYLCINSRNDTVRHYLDRIACKLCVSSD